MISNVIKLRLISKGELMPCHIANLLIDIACCPATVIFFEKILSNEGAIPKMITEQANINGGS